MCAKPTADDRPKPPAEEKPGLRTPVVKSLLDLGGKKKKAPQDRSRPEPPFKLGDGQQVSIGFVTKDGLEAIFPWIHVSVTMRQGEQLTLGVGEYIVTLVFDLDRAAEQKWQTDELMDAIHQQTLAWIYHRPDDGLSLEIAKAEKEEEG